MNSTTKGKGELQRLDTLPTDPYQRCVAKVKIGLNREVVRSQLKNLLTGEPCDTQFSFGQITGEINGSEIVVDPPREIAWKLRAKGLQEIKIPLLEIIDETDTELYHLLQQRLETLSVQASESPQHAPHVPVLPLEHQILRAQ